MPVTQLDPKTALLLVDLQNGFRSLPTVHPMHDVVGNAVRLARTFRERRLKVVLITVAGAPPGRTDSPRMEGERPEGWADPLPELEGADTDHVIVKRTWGAFTETGLAKDLRTVGVTQVVVAGVATSMGVESTARQAYELGFHVTFAIDAITDLDAEAHLHSTLIFAKIGEVGSTSDIISMLERNDPSFR
ncbi:isochorismatase family protein [Sphingomonas sp. PAMC26645]|uniref:isochorismatase family protein n=1 Tax=Sphingomonas sp. PAMC26645 TaxID=2565555 RepID=UPI00109D92F0|nr:isochorismatase family protein [Sphingomonas sp. PAMC26645]QCB43272.1 isochorismatase family protein [Sphingomonas sp. PAMC26645]